MLIGGALFFAVIAILTGMVNSVSALLAIRLFAGMGLGSIIPNATALVGDFDPEKVPGQARDMDRHQLTAGAAIGGFVAGLAYSVVRLAVGVLRRRRDSPSSSRS